MALALWLLIGAVTYSWMRFSYRSLFYKDSLTVALLKIPDVEDLYRKLEYKPEFTYQKFSAALNTMFMIVVILAGPVGAICAPNTIKALKKLQ